MTLAAAIAALQAHALTAGASEAPDLPTETNITWPFSVCYPGSGKIIGESAGMEKDLITAFLEAFKPLLIADPTLGGTVQTIVMDNAQPIRFEFGRMSYAGVETLGFRFSIILKQKP